MGIYYLCKAHKVITVIRIIMKVKLLKRFLPIIICTLLTSCSAIQPRDRVTNIMFIDYRPYVSADFHISPNAYTQPHNVLGELMIEVYPAIKEGQTKESKFADGIYSSGFSANKVYKETITPEELLEIAVSYALKLGADGIANFDAKVIYNTTHLKSGEIIQSVSHYEIKGLCIDRL